MNKPKQSLSNLKSVKAALAKEREAAEKLKAEKAKLEMARIAQQEKLAEQAQISHAQHQPPASRFHIDSNQVGSEFSALFSDVKPLKNTNSMDEIIHSQNAAKAAIKAQAQLKSISAIVVNAENKKSALFNEDYSGFIRVGYNQKKAHKYLSQHGPKAKITLDVHGLRQQEAIDYINYAVDEALKDNFDCVKIIHGKGLHSHNNESILQPTTIDTLALHPHTILTMEANHQDGGSGATYALLSPLITK